MRSFREQTPQQLNRKGWKTLDNHYTRMRKNAQTPIVYECQNPPSSPVFIHHEIEIKRTIFVIVTITATKKKLIVIDTRLYMTAIIWPISLKNADEPDRLEPLRLVLCRPRCHAQRSIFCFSICQNHIKWLWNCMRTAFVCCTLHVPGFKQSRKTL